LHGGTGGQERQSHVCAMTPVANTPPPLVAGSTHIPPPTTQSCARTYHGTQTAGSAPLGAQVRSRLLSLSPHMLTLGASRMLNLGAAHMWSSRSPASSLSPLSAQAPRSSSSIYCSKLASLRLGLFRSLVSPAPLFYSNALEPNENTCTFYIYIYTLLLMCACHATPVARAPATRVPGGVLAASTRDGEATRHLGPGLEGLPRPGKDTSAEVGPPTRGFGPQVRAAVVSCVHWAVWVRAGAGGCVCGCVVVWVCGVWVLGSMGVVPYAQRVSGL
jgi:hypothetical protein